MTSASSTGSVDGLMSYSAAMAAANTKLDSATAK
jgi:hypothetical protein